MPCNSDYMEPTDLEQRLQETAALIVHFGKALNIHVTKKHKRASKDFYCADDYVDELCTALRALGKDKRDKLIYGNPKDKKARQLATWWEEHELADRQRKQKERKEAAIAKIRQIALTKLSKKEKLALGIGA